MEAPWQVSIMNSSSLYLRMHRQTDTHSIVPQRTSQKCPVLFCDARCNKGLLMRGENQSKCKMILSGIPNADCECRDQNFAAACLNPGCLARSTGGRPVLLRAPIALGCREANRKNVHDVNFNTKKSNTTAGVERITSDNKLPALCVTVLLWHTGDLSTTQDAFSLPTETDGGDNYRQCWKWHVQVNTLICTFSFCSDSVKWLGCKQLSARVAFGRAVCNDGV